MLAWEVLGYAVFQSPQGSTPPGGDCEVCSSLPWERCAGTPPGKEARTATVRVPRPTLSTERPPREGDYLESVAAAPAPSAKAHF